MSRDLVYVVHPEAATAEKLGLGLEAADYEVVTMSSVERAHEILGGTHPRELTMHDPSKEEPAHEESESVTTVDLSSQAGS